MDGASGGKKDQGELAKCLWDDCGRTFGELGVFIDHITKGSSLALHVPFRLVSLWPLSCWQGKVKAGVMTGCRLSLVAALHR